MTAIITAKNITKRYGGEHIFDPLSLEIQKNKIVYIFGPNGSGKTTLLNILTRTIPADEGQVEVKVNSIGFSWQIPDLPSYLTISESKELFGEIYQADKDWIEFISGFLETKKWNNTLVGELSGGTKKKLDILFSLFPNPELLVLDEPTASLDKEAREKLFSLLKKLKEKGKTILIASHDLEIKKICDYGFNLKDGQLTRIENKKN